MGLEIHEAGRMGCICHEIYTIFNVFKLSCVVLRLYFDYIIEGVEIL